MLSPFFSKKGGGRWEGLKKQHNGIGGGGDGGRKGRGRGEFVLMDFKRYELEEGEGEGIVLYGGEESGEEMP